MKRLLQKDPNRRLSFEAFFAHPFLSGQSIQRQPHTLHETEVVFEEPDSSVIEDDYVILSIPSPKDAMAQRSDQQQSIQTPAHSVSRMQIRSPVPYADQVFGHRSPSLCSWSCCSTSAFCVQAGKT